MLSHIKSLRSILPSNHQTWQWPIPELNGRSSSEIHLNCAASFDETKRHMSIWIPLVGVFRRVCFGVWI